MISVVDSGRRVVRARDHERALFTTTGGWVRTMPEPAPKVALARFARLHADHADQWDRIVPVLHAVDLGAPAPTDLDALVHGLAGAGPSSRDRLARYGVVLEGLVSAHERWSQEAAWESDGPVRRVLERVLDDLRAARGQIEALRGESGRLGSLA